MHNGAALVRQIIHLARNSGYLAPDHAVSVAGNILDAKPLPDEFAVLAPALIRMAALFDPFDREKLRLARDVDGRVAHASFTRWLDQARQLTDGEPVPDNLPHPDPQGAPPAAFVEYIEAQSANVSRLPVLMHLWQAGARDELVRAIRIMAASPSGLLAGPLMAWGAYGAGEPLLAQMLLDEGVENFLASNLRARLALDVADTHAARDHLLQSLEAEPFQPAIIEQLATLPSASTTPGDDTCVLLYTWNKPDLLAGTMASLAATDLGESRVIILNNGTTDCSPDELEQRVKAAAPDLPVRWVHLPVNVGAPAARNWLLSLPEVRQTRLAAFLDDDVLLPQDWLVRYEAALERFPEACAVGPKCVNQGVRTIQYAFRGFQETGEHTIRFTPNAPTLMDMGQFDGPRPSLTVMGCCHLLHLERLRDRGVPGFDVRFSPSQVDDIEHDLQIWKAGGQVIYDGSVEVIHLQDTGATRDRASLGHAFANHYKMEHKFRAEELQAMDAAHRQADERHFSDCLAEVLPSLNGAASVFWRTLAPSLK